MEYQMRREMINKTIEEKELGMIIQEDLLSDIKYIKRKAGNEHTVNEYESGF